MLHRRSGASLLVTLVLLSLLVVVSPPLSEPAAAGPGDAFTLTKTDDVGGQALIGEHVTYTLTAEGTQASNAYLYNLSFRDVLPVGTAFVSAEPAATAVLIDVPSTGRTTVIWENVADLPAGSFASVSYVIDTNPDFAPTTGGATTVPVGSTITTTGQAVASLDAFRIPDWDGTGTFTGDYDGDSGNVDHSMDVVPFRVTKTGPGELLRGVHDAGFGGRGGSSGDDYTIVVENNPDYATTAINLTDTLGPELEFLGCENYYPVGDDNSTDVPLRSSATPDEEWSGSGPMATGAGTCVTPASIATVDALVDGVLANTMVTWNLGDLAPAATHTVRYHAGIPMRANTLIWTTSGGAPAGPLAQGRNLDNNAGPSTNELDRTLSADPDVLVDGAPAVTNTAVATGTYSPSGNPETASDVHTTEAEDIVIGKSMSGSLTHGDVVQSTLVVSTGEYRDFTDLVVRDLMPSALCFTGTFGSDTTPGGSDWATNDCPGAGSGTGTATTVRELPSGGPYGTGRFELVWDTASVPGLAALASDESITIVYDAVVRTTYRGGLAALPGEPVLAGDQVRNRAEVSGPDFVVAEHTNDNNADDEAGGGLDGDTASAELTNSLPSIDKKIATKTLALADGAGADETTCGTAYGSLSFQDTVATGFGPGDIVCFLLEATFPNAIDTENVLIQDLLPPGYTYVADSEAAVAGDDLVGVTFDDTTLRWDLGTVDNPGHTFRRVIGVLLGAPDEAVAGDIHANLQKMIHNQNGGIVYQYRDEVPAEWTEPQLDLTKGVKQVDATNNSLDTGPFGADHDGSASGGSTSVLVQSDAAVTFRVDVTNDGNKTADSVEVWDELPTGLDCSMVTSITASGSCAGGASGTTVTWTVPSIAAGTSTELNYVLTMPADTVADESFVNTAGVRHYQAQTNTGLYDYYPRNNIDGSVVANTDAADDQAFLHTAAPSVAKTQASGIAEAGNTRNAPASASNDQFTVGEVIAYEVTLTIPDGTTVLGGEIADILPANMRYVEGKNALVGGVEIPLPTAAVASIDTDANAVALDSGSITHPAPDSAGTVRYTLPAIYENPADGTSHSVTLTFYAQLTGGSRGATRTNSATFDHDDASASPQPTRTSNQVVSTVVAPVPTITKTHTVPAGNAVAPGDTITYQVSVANSGASNVSLLHDVEVVDTVPVGVTPARDGGGAVSVNGDLVATAGVSLAGPFTGTWSQDDRTITWTRVDWTPLESIDPGASHSFTYQALVDDPATASGTLTNSAAMSGTNLDADTDPLIADGSTVTDTDTDQVDLPDATLVKDIEPAGAPDRATVTVGEPLDYTVTVSLPTNTRAYDLTLFDELPAGLTFDGFGGITVGADCVELPGSGALASGAIETLAPSVGGSAKRFAWFLGDVLATGPNCTVDVAYTLHVDSAASAPDTLVNSATLVWNQTDEIADPTPTTLPATHDTPTDPAWDVSAGPDTQTITVVEPQLELDEDVTRTGIGIGPCDTTPGNNRTGADDADTQSGALNGCDVEAGDALRYSLTATNTGTANAHDTVVVDVLPDDVRPLVSPGGAEATDGQTVVGSTGSTAVWNAATHTLTWDLSGTTIAAGGGTRTLDFDAVLSPSAQLTEGQDFTTDADIPSYWALALADRTAITTGDVPEYGNGGTADRGGLLPDTTTVEVHFPQLTVTKSATDDATDARFDTDFGWQLVIDNTSTAAAAYGIDAVDDLPPGWSYVANSARVTLPGASAVAIEPTVAGSKLTWTGLLSGLGQPLDPGAQIIITFDTQPQSSVLAPDATTGETNTGPSNPHTNATDVAGDDGSGASGCCDTGSGVVPYADAHSADAVIRRIDLSVTKAILDSPPIHHGDIVTYSIQVTNAGPSVATNVALADVFAPDHTYVSTALIETGTFTPGTFTWAIPSIGVGVTYELQVRLVVDAAGSVTNTVQVTAADQWDPDSTPDNDNPFEDDQASVSITALGSDLGNRIWLDLNADGVQDGSEPGIEGVDVGVSWLDADTTLQVRSTTTDADGNWSISDLPVDTPLTVTVNPGTPADPAGTGGAGSTLPPGLTPTWELADSPDVTAPQAGNGHASGLDHETGGIVLTTTTTSYLDVDFGYTGANSIGDELWFDADGGGESAPEAGDQPLIGAHLTVTWAGFDDDFDTAADNQEWNATTDASGLYLVTGLPDGRYTVVVIDDAALPSGATPTYDLDGIGTPHDSGIFDLGVGQSAPDDRRDLDFAYAGTASLGDTVWFDHNGDGVYDTGTEVPLAGVRVVATFDLPGGSTQTVEAFTDADGQYSFGDLPLDVPISVEVDPTTLPPGFTPTFDLDGTGTPHVAVATLTTGQPVRTDVDFGYAGAGTIGDLVWLDLDNSGTATADPGEPGLSGVELTLTWTNPTGAADLVLTTTTDPDGSYLFEHLPAGAYTVAVTTAPAGVNPTHDPDGGADLTSAVTLGDGADDLDQDFSFGGTSSLGDTVWHDANGDGALDVGEALLGGIDVVITWTDPATGASVVLGATTAGDGTYLVTDLPAGPYTVAVDPTTLASGFGPTYDLDGGNDNEAAVTLGDGEARLDVDFGYRPTADLGITKTHDGDFRVGEENRWTITLTNAGPAPAIAPVTVSDPLPAGVTFVDADGDGWLCADAAGIVTCTLVDGDGTPIDLAVDAETTFDLVVDVDAAAAPGVTNVATTSSGTADDNPDDNEATDETLVPLAVLRLDKTLADTLVAGQDATYILTLTNTGPSPSNGTITVTDALPDGLDHRATRAPNLATCGAANDVITCTIDQSLGVDETVTIEIDAQVTADTGASVVNGAEVQGGNLVNGAQLPDAEVLGAGAVLADDAGAQVEAASSLPFTGGTAAAPLWVGLLLLAAGGVLLVVRRRL